MKTFKVTMTSGREYEVQAANEYDARYEAHRKFNNGGCFYLFERRITKVEEVQTAEV
jgi:hypothetical protein